jgi:2'-5' RNA ligase
MQTNNFYEQVWEYRLVISPPDEVNRSIGKIKKEVGVKYGNSHTIHSSAYISLVKFLLVKGCERNLLSRLFSFCINKMPVEIMLNNFDVFPSHMLYVNVMENQGLKKLQNELTSLLIIHLPVYEKLMKAAKKHYMSIAGNLSPLQFEPIAKEYKGRHINTSFRAKRIVMLKRPYGHNTGSCRRYGSHNFILGCC